jgi:hypothetical protein
MISTTIQRIRDLLLSPSALALCPRPLSSSRESPQAWPARGRQTMYRSSRSRTRCLAQYFKQTVLEKLVDDKVYWLGNVAVSRAC